MSRFQRGTGPRPAHRSPLAQFFSSRERERVRARMIVAIVGAVCAAVLLALLPQRQLHAPVLVAIGAGTPAVPLENLETLVAVSLPPEPAFEPIDAVLAGLDPRRLGDAVGAVRQEVRRGGMPGAAVVLGRGNNVVEKAGIGRLAPGMAEVDPAGTLYDLASLTKVVATTTAVMLLVEDGRMSLDAPVSRYLPEFTGGSKGGVTIRHLLAHTSGLPAGVGLPSATPEAGLRRLIATPLRSRPGERVVYSDVGPIVLFTAAERVAGEPLSVLLQRRVFEPLGMRDTGFNPRNPCHRCAPTAQTIHGRVHDPLAWRLGGIAGNAGLFATASDIGRFAAMLAGGGELEGVRVLKEETIREFTARQPGAGTRALGWDTRNPRGSGAGGRQTSPLSFGHTGFTGTSLWIDPERGTWAVLLANRTYQARAPNRMQALRRTLNDRLAEAADLAVAD